MKLNIAILFLFAGLMILSCKKEPEPSPINTSSAPNNNPTPSNASLFSGIFIEREITTETATGPVSSTNTTAYFTFDPAPIISLQSAVTVNKVYFNGDSLPYIINSGYYRNNSANLAAHTWSVNGANGIGTFSISNNFTVPSFSIVGNLPDSVYQSVGFNVVVNDIANATHAGLEILLRDSIVPLPYYNTSLQQNNNIVITPAEMASYVPVGQVTVIITAADKKVFLISGKDYEFSRQKQWVKVIKVKP